MLGSRRPPQIPGENPGLEFKPSTPLSIGAELELQLLDAETLDLRDGIMPLMELYPDTPFVKPEYVQNTVEVASKVCGNLDELESHLTVLVSELKRKCNALDMALCAAGTHAFGEQLAIITPVRRYLQMEKQERYLSHTQVTFATHVHIGMRSGAEALAVMRDLRPYLPLLIAVSASSPFWRGYDTGYAAYRHRILAATRSYGIPPSFATWDDFCHFVESTHKAGIFATVNDIHWDIRPRPHLGTLEVRVMDAQPTVTEVVALVGFVRALIAFLRDTKPADRPAGLPIELPWWFAKENHFQASRLGLASRCMTAEQGTVGRMSDVVNCVIDAIAPSAVKLGQSNYLERFKEIVEGGPSYRRQRDVFKRTKSMKEVVASLVDELASDLPVPQPI